ncbi:hypothetical protein [Tardiphaga sp.]|jgi:hypothetical protein|uniref:hypothetical protein n=1 Tax=Tardiphaga sp. TaxID=1926292 RepID=UPI0037D9E68D
MALKDLVAKKSEVDEAVIEAIVSKYVRYYTDTVEIGFTPECASLSGESKLLVYLVALLGWQYVTDSVPETSTKPADLEKVLGIPGNTLRPILKTLKDAHLIAPGALGYNAREGNLEDIAAAISGERKTARRKVALGAPAKSKASTNSTRRSTANAISSNIDAFIDDGFFDSTRTLRAVHEKLHERGVIARQTSVSGPLLRAVQQKRLKRQKVMEDNKEVWAYCVVEA